MATAEQCPTPVDDPAVEPANTASAGHASTSGATNVAPLSLEAISRLDDDGLIAACKSQFTKTDTSYSVFRRDKDLLAAIYDAMVVRFRDDTLKGDKRDGKPTLRQAFDLAGWNYDAARKFKQRHEQELKQRLLTSYENPARSLQLAAGNLVKAKAGGNKGTVVHVHESAPKVDVLFEGNTKAATVPTESLTKVAIPVRKIKVNDLVLCEDNGAEYRYVGNGQFQRTQKPTLLQQEQERELAAIKAKQDREAAKAREKERQQELRKVEAAKRDFCKIAEAKAGKEAAQKRTVANAARPKKHANKAEAATAKVTKTEQVVVARIGETKDFGVYPESCKCEDHDTAHATTIGTREACEAERDRINATRAFKASDDRDVPLEKVADAAKAQAQQEAA